MQSRRKIELDSTRYSQAEPELDATRERWGVAGAVAISHNIYYEKERKKKDYKKNYLQFCKIELVR